MLTAHYKKTLKKTYTVLYQSVSTLLKHTQLTTGQSKPSTFSRSLPQSRVTNVIDVLSLFANSLSTLPMCTMPKSLRAMPMSESLRSSQKISTYRFVLFGSITKSVYSVLLIKASQHSRAPQLVNFSFASSNLFLFIPLSQAPARKAIF